MKKNLSRLMATGLMAFAFLVFYSFREKGNEGKFYYGFSTKIFIREIPDEYAVTFRDAAAGKTILTSLQQKKKLSSLKWERPNVALLSAAAADIDVLLKRSDVLVKKGYKVQEQKIYYADEIIIEPLKQQSIEKILAAEGLSKADIIKFSGFYYVVKIPFSKDACDVANKIQESGQVLYAHPNFMAPQVADQYIPNDPFFNNQYYLRNTGQVFNPVENHSGTPGADIKASYAWDITKGSSSIIVAVLDDGVSVNHPDLPASRQVRLNGSNFMTSAGESPNDPSPNLAIGDKHGNSCAGIIAASQDNGEGISGIAPNVKIMPIRVLSTLGGAGFDGNASAIDFAWQHGAHVLSCSFSFETDNPNFAPVIVQALQRATTQGRGGLGCVVAFAASNTARHTAGYNGIVHFPANAMVSGVLSVGASDRYNAQADYSPTSNAASPNNQIIDIVAPSHRAFPPAYYQCGFPPLTGGIANEHGEVWTIDNEASYGYNPWQSTCFGTVGETVPSSGINYLSYTMRFGGTSAACPQVAAVAALVLSVNNSLTQQQVFDILTSSADKVGGYTYSNCWSAELGHGKLNAFAALAQVTSTNIIYGPALVCTSDVFSIPGAPVGAAISWSSSNTSIATVSGSGPSCTVTKAGIGVFNLTATVTACGVVRSYTKSGIRAGGYNNYEVQLSGYVMVPLNYPSTYSVNLANYPGISNLVWGWPNTPPSAWTYLYGGNGGSYVVLRSPSSYPSTGDIRLSFSACGINNIVASRWVAWGYGGPMYYRVAPNPASTIIKIEQYEEASGKALAHTNIQLVEISDKMGNKVMSKTFNKGTPNGITIPVEQLRNDVYTVRIFNGTEWKSYKIIVQH